jgi:UDP-N-acetylmuramoyl-L-alanyl-D-glutamate--2,6-diaminopimelate ligase
MDGAMHSAPQAAQWLAERVRGRLRMDSRAVQPGDGFIAWPGLTTDGRHFVQAALDAGAAACLVEAQGAEANAFDPDRVARVPGLKAATGAIADLYFAQPSAVLDVVATTGTNGKTSTAWWTAQALTRLGRRCGVVGTLGVGEPPAEGQGASAGAADGSVTSTGLTTPDPVTLHAAFRGFVDMGFAACALEASSIGLAEQRLAAARIDVALFTNFTRDHLDYHGSMARYWEAKRALFDWPGLKSAVINTDDEHGSALAAELARSPLDLWTVSLQHGARLQASGLRYSEAGLAFEVSEGGAQASVHSRLVGEFNASNLLVVIGGLRALGVTLGDAAQVAAALTPVPGRLQRVSGGDLDVVVDYAHTPDALAKVLQALRPLATARGSRLWCVFGCGGNRDASKRPLMGAIAAAGADHVVLTSDNPRGESPAEILAQILAGLPAGSDADELTVIEDRRLAIAHAVRSARPGDVVLLAGKGHEDYQEIAGERRPFSDLAEARAMLALRDGTARAPGLGGQH